MAGLARHFMPRAGVGRGGDPLTTLVTAQAIDFLYRNLPSVVVGVLLMPVLMVVVMWTRIDHAVLLSWAAGVGVVAGARLVLCKRYLQSRPPPQQAWRWGWYFTVTSFLNGLLWGSAALLFFVPDSAALQVFLFVSVIGLSTGALIAASYWPMSFYAFAFPALSLSALRLALEGSAAYVGLAALMLLHVAVMVPLARNAQRASLAAIRLRFENLDLVQQLSAQRDAAERANVAKSKFLAAASHDLRQPLHTLSLFTSVLDEQIKFPKVRRIVDNIAESVRALEKMFDVLLDVSRFDAGVLQASPHHFRLQQLLRRVTNDFAHEAQAKDLRFECETDEYVVVSDPALLERIVRNFVANAVRYTEAGEVRIRCVSLGDSVRIEVRDTGIGIPPAQHRAIFEEFHQLGNPERDRSKGLGLGLAIVDRAARLLNHPVGVDSGPGQGSCFSVTVPCGDPQRIAEDDDRRVTTAPADLRGLRVLIVDDESGARESARALLKRWGCSVLVAASEDEAVAALEKAAPPDAVIADYRLRDGRTGVQAIERLRRTLGREITALIVTGDTAAEHLRDAKASGQQVVHKPVPPAMLRAFLGNARARQRANARTPSAERGPLADATANSSSPAA